MSGEWSFNLKVLVVEFFLACVYERVIMRQGRGSEETEDVFCLRGKKASSYRGAYRVPLFNLSVSVCV